MNDKTTIQISKENHKRLKEIAEASNSTFDEIIRYFLEKWEKEKNVEEDYDEYILSL